VPPATSTIGRILERNDLVAKRKSKPKASTRYERSAPNELWQIDATQITLSDGVEVWIIDVLDDHSRYLLEALAVDRLTSTNAWACVEGSLCLGVPQEIVTDNGTCFTGRSLRGYEIEFERRIAALGIKHIKTAPYHPQTIGKIERLHRTLKAWLRLQPPPADIAELQALVDKFRSYYNHDRCHQGIVAESQQTRPKPQRCIRKVDATGKIGMRGALFHIGRRHAGLLVDVEMQGDHIHVAFDSEIIARFDYVPGKRYHSRRR
jgi:transposase InsO family protein